MVAQGSLYPLRDGLRVLIVDPWPDTAESFAWLVREWGHEVRVARTGLEAVREAAVFQSDVVLMELGLPGIDGLEVARRLRGCRSQSMLVAMTGYGGASFRDESRAAGFDYHLIKPVEPDGLRELLACYQEWPAQPIRTRLATYGPGRELSW
jgi:CheY-like chemotaxis protein